MRLDLNRASRACRRFLIKAGACILVMPFASATELRPLPLEEALRLAEQRSARLTAQRAAIDALSEQIPRVSELPDPKLRLGIENLPISNPDAFSFTRDSMTMRRFGYMQEMPNSQKRAARTERVTRERAVETASLAAQRAQLRQDVALAWFELYYARQLEQALGRLAESFRAEAETTGPAVTARRLPLSAAVASRAAVEGVHDRVLEQRRNAARARAVLSGLIADAAERPPDGAADVTALPHGAESLVGGIDAHPTQRIYEAREALAASEIELAESTVKPDWSWEVILGQREPRYSNMVTIMFSIDLPVRKSARQERDIATREKQLEQARAQREDARRLHGAEIRSLVAEWQIAGERARHFEQTLLPLARDRAELELIAYRGGRAELAAVLEAQRAQTDIELSQIGAELDRARAWARLNFLVLQDEQP
jgi:outer membrane protein, heavy metal efflux system